MMCRKKRQYFVNYAQKGCCTLYKCQIAGKGGQKVTIIYSPDLKAQKNGEKQAKNGEFKLH